MGTALMKIRIMPESPETDLDELQKKAEQIIIQNKGQNPKFERQPIAFGLTALIANFAIDESLPTDPFEENLRNIEKVSSAETIDFRRAFG
jgi:elongation factor 1-beta